MQNTFSIYTDFNSEDLTYNHRLMEKVYNFPPHIHDVCELVFLKKGDITYTVEGKAYRLTKNSLIIAKPLQIHSITMNSQIPYERYNILFDEKKLSTDIYNRIASGPDVINFDGNTLVTDLFKKMDYYCENFEEFYLKSVLSHLTEEILYHVFLTAKNLEQNSVYTVNPLINRAIEYIEGHITEPLDITTLCEVLHVTRSHLNSLFVKHLKISPKKYIISKKLALAQRELRLGVKSTEVAANCGFADYSTFFRAYRNEFGHAPSDEISIKIVRKIES